MIVVVGCFLQGGEGGGGESGCMLMRIGEFCENKGGSLNICLTCLYSTYCLIQTPFIHSIH